MRRLDQRVAKLEVGSEANGLSYEELVESFTKSLHPMQVQGAIDGSSEWLSAEEFARITPGLRRLLEVAE